MSRSSAFGGIDAETLARRASSFGGQAAAYARERPDYPDDAVLWALEPVSGRVPLRVLDLGAGTGKLTEVLLRHTSELAEGAKVAEVIAVEPDPAMLDQLRRRLPEAQALTGSAEKIPLPDGSVDAILIGQALHWFDLDRALPEMARVLTPGGVLAGLWNLDDDQIPWVRELKRVARSTVSFTNWRSEEIPLRGPWFQEVEQARFPHVQRRTAETMAATIATHSHVLTLPDSERAELLARVVDYLRSTPETAHGEFELPIITAVVRAPRE
ncbi:class I SAM-dependent methyltransferase [Streptosporangium sp. NPDC004631]